MDFPETFFEPNWENVECFNGLTAKWVNMIYFHLFLYLCHYLESCDRWKILTLVKIIYINIVLVLSVRLKPVRPSVRQSRFSARLHIWVMNFQILLAFYRNKYLYMRTAHTRFGCIAPTGNRVMSLRYFQHIYIYSRQINLLPGRISWWWIFRFYYHLPKISMGILYWRCLSILLPSGRPAMNYRKLTKGSLWNHLPPTTGKLSVAYGTRVDP